MGFCGKWTKMVKIVNGILWQMDENGENSEWKEQSWKRFIIVII